MPHISSRAHSIALYKTRAMVSALFGNVRVKTKHNRETVQTVSVHANAWHLQVLGMWVAQAALQHDSPFGSAVQQAHRHLAHVQLNVLWEPEPGLAQQAVSEAWGEPALLAHVAAYIESGKSFCMLFAGSRRLHRHAARACHRQSKHMQVKTASNICLSSMTLTMFIL